MRIVNNSLMVILIALIGFSCSQQNNEQVETDSSDQVSPGPHWDGELLDPYDILRNYYQALGGLETVKQHKSSYMRGSIEVVGAGLEGIFEQWNKYPIFSKEFLDLKVMTQTSGDNGEYKWELDMNGNLQIKRDQNTLQARELSALTADYEHLNPESEIFKIRFLGVDTAAAKYCYVLEITNSLNEDTTLEYYDSSTYLLIKKIEDSQGHQTHTVYSDYREVEGVLYAFHQHITIMPIKQEVDIMVEQLEVNVNMDSSLFQPPQTDSGDYSFANGKFVENIPIKYIHDHVFIQAEVEGEKNWWILDCGAGKTVVSAEYAQQLGLDVQGNITGGGAGNTVEVSLATLPPLSIDQLQFDSQIVVVIEIKPFMTRLMRTEVVGILGYDFLSRFVTKIDYARELISFYDQDYFNYEGPGTVIDAPLEDNMFVVEAAVDSIYQGKWRLDIGATGLGFHFPYAQQEKLLELNGVPTIAFGAGGEIHSKLYRFNKFEIAGYTVDDPIIAIPLEKGEGALADRRYMGNLGNTVLRHFILYLDYPGQTVILEPGDNYEKVFPTDHSGLGIWDGDQGVEIFFVAEGTPGDQAGLEKGDVIEEIDGQSVEEFAGLQEIRDVFKQPPGTEVVLSVVRDGQTVDINLILEDLFADLE
ncbi:MAG: aspartyl protease family protein [bacterium]